MKIKTFACMALILSCCSLSACADFKKNITSEETKAELKAVGADIIDAVEVSAAETALAAARAKLAEIEATPLPPDADLSTVMLRTLAITTARSLFNLAQTRVDKLKARRAALDKNPVNVTAFNHHLRARSNFREGRTRPHLSVA